jgi:ribosome-binding ATPase YchF (GTP1/OBG family)
MAAFLAEARPITAKKVIYCANVDEEGIDGQGPAARAVAERAAARGAEFAVVCARMEEELAGLEEAERLEFLSSYGVAESGLDQVIAKGYGPWPDQLFHRGPKEVRAWTVTRGARARSRRRDPHGFRTGFIRAEIISFEDYVRHGSEAKCRAAGHALEGRI